MGEGGRGGVGSGGPAASVEDAEERPQPVLWSDVPEHPEALPEEGAISELIRSYDWDDETALRIVYGPTSICPTGESGGRADAVSYDGTSYGLFQLHAPTWANVFPDFWTRWMDAAWNIARACDIYVRAGYSFWPWACWW